LPTLCLALAVEGMFAELGYGFGHRFDLLTLYSNAIDIDDVIDLTTERGRAAAGIELSAMGCLWAYDVASGQTPASWMIARALLAKGAAGILAPFHSASVRNRVNA
jgi:RES domain-containing protein